MSATIYQNSKYIITRYWGGKNVMHQITPQNGQYFQLTDDEVKEFSTHLEKCISTNLSIIKKIMEKIK